MTRERPEVSVDDVRSYWNIHPLFTFESTAELGSLRFFDEHNRVRQEDVETFAMRLHEFSEHTGQLVLDIDCGVGWLCEHFARGGAHVIGLDITENGTRITKERLAAYGLRGTAVQGDAERLPFEDAAFDFVTASGVLHHTPNTQHAIDEVFRVLRPGGRAMISIYRRNWLMSPPTWPFTRLAVRCLFGSLPGRSGFQNLRTPDDLVRVYDGNDNPLGKAYSRRETLDMLRAFTIERHEVHYFPRRFLPLGRRIPRFLHMLLDRWMGLMLYVLVRKPEYSL